MVTRRLPRWCEFAPLLRTRRTSGSRAERRVSRAADVDDLRRIARRRVPRSVFDYVDGGASGEVSMRRAREAFDRIEFVPRVLRDVAVASTATTVLGAPSAMPLVFAPTGYSRMMHHEGERAVARVAARVGIPYALSTVGTTTPEDVAIASGSGRRWFQLYVWNDRERSRRIIERAAHAGFEALVLTVDVPVAATRLRDVRNGLTIPPTLTPRTFIDGLLHPRWLFDFLTTEPLSFATMTEGSMTIEEVASNMFDASVTWDDLRWFRDIWPGKLVVKGVQRVDDAARLPDYGVDAVVLSNHGGRQLDRSAVSLELLPDVVSEVGNRLEVLVDGGARSGADVIAAIALGASAVLVGRPYLYGLMAGGEAGVQRVSDLLHTDMLRTMQLLGATSVDQLDDSLVRLRR